MCPNLAPLIMGVATAGLGAAQTVMAHQGATEQSKEVRRAALADHAQKSTELTRRQLQEDDAISQRIQVQNIEEAQGRAATEVQSAASGVAGVSLDNLLADVSRTTAGNRETLRENSRNLGMQLQLEKKGAGATAESRIRSAPRPSSASLVAGLAGNAMAGFNAYDRRMG